MGPAGGGIGRRSPTRTARLSVGDVTVPVRAEPAADHDRVAAASAQLAVKYASDPSLGSMLRADVLETTLELLPR